MVHEKRKKDRCGDLEETCGKNPKNEAKCMSSSGTRPLPPCSNKVSQNGPFTLDNFKNDSTTLRCGFPQPWRQGAWTTSPKRPCNLVNIEMREKPKLTHPSQPVLKQPIVVFQERSTSSTATQRAETEEEDHPHLSLETGVALDRSNTPSCSTKPHRWKSLVSHVKKTLNVPSGSLAQKAARHFGSRSGRYSLVNPDSNAPEDQGIPDIDRVPPKLLTRHEVLDAYLSDEPYTRETADAQEKTSQDVLSTVQPPSDVEPFSDDMSSTTQSSWWYSSLQFFLFVRQLPRCLGCQSSCTLQESNQGNTIEASYTPSQLFRRVQHGVFRLGNSFRARVLATGVERIQQFRERLGGIRTRLQQRLSDVRSFLHETTSLHAEPVTPHNPGTNHQTMLEEASRNFEDDPTVQQLLFLGGFIFGSFFFCLGGLLYFITPRQLLRTRLWGFINIIFCLFSFFLFFSLQVDRNFDTSVTYSIELFQSDKHIEENKFFYEAGMVSREFPFSVPTSPRGDLHFQFSRPESLHSWEYAVFRDQNKSFSNGLPYYERIFVSTEEILTKNLSLFLPSVLDPEHHHKGVYALGSRVRSNRLSSSGEKTSQNSFLKNVFWSQSFYVSGKAFVSMTLKWGGDLQDLSSTWTDFSSESLSPYGIHYRVLNPTNIKLLLIPNDRFFPMNFVGPGLHCNLTRISTSSSLEALLPKIPQLLKSFWFLVSKNQGKMVFESLDFIVFLPSTLHQLVPSLQNNSTVRELLNDRVTWKCRVVLINNPVMTKKETNASSCLLVDAFIRGLP